MAPTWFIGGKLYSPGIRQRNTKTVYTFGKRFESIIEDKILKPGMDVEYITIIPQ